MLNIFKIFAIAGLLCIISGLITIKIKQRKLQYILFIFGGIFLEIYSISIGDWIFIVLQGVYTVISIYELIKIKNIKKKK